MALLMDRPGANSVLGIRGSCGALLACTLWAIECPAAMAKLALNTSRLPTSLCVLIHVCLDRYTQGRAFGVKVGRI